jgi:hypothetical protein
MEEIPTVWKLIRREDFFGNYRYQRHIFSHHSIRRVQKVPGILLKRANNALQSFVNMFFVSISDFYKVNKDCVNFFANERN